MEEWIEEFLFRGKPPTGPGSDRTPAFHVVIGQQAESPLDPAEKVRKVLGPMSLTDAETIGWTFDDIVAGMNSAAINRCAELEATINALQEEVASLKATQT